MVSGVKHSKPCAGSARTGRVDAFLKADRGAVAVDWTVLGGSLVAMSVGAVMIVSGGLGDLSGSIRDRLSDSAVTTAFTPPDGTGTNLTVDLQAADQAQLQQIRGIGEARAATLIAARDQHGLDLNTATVDDLQALHGFGAVLSERVIQFRDHGCVDTVCL